MPYMPTNWTRVYSFNDTLELLAESPDPCPPGEKPVWILGDVSASMNDGCNANEFKMLFSCFKAICSNPRDAFPNFPVPSGRTNLIGALMALRAELAAFPEAERPNLLIATDGDDNDRTTMVVPIDMDADGNVIERDLTDTAALQTSGQTYQEARSESILKYATNILKAQTYVVGIGASCSDILRMARKMPVVTARLAGNSTAAQVVAVAKKLVNTTPRKRTARDSKSIAPDPADDATAAPDDAPIETPIIEIGNLAGQDAPENFDAQDEEVVRTTRRERAHVVFGESMVIDDFINIALDAEKGADQSMIEKSDANWAPTDAQREYCRAAIWWLMNEAQDADQRLAGAHISSKLDGYYLPPDGLSNSHYSQYLNRLLSQLKARNILDCTPKVQGHAVKVGDREKITTRNGVDCYAPSALVAPLLTRIIDNTAAGYTVANFNLLVQRPVGGGKGKKRARADGGSGSDSDAPAAKAANTTADPAA